MDRLQQPSGARDTLRQRGPPSSSANVRTTQQSARNEREDPGQNRTENSSGASTTREKPKVDIDFGVYDGGLEAENMVRGEEVTGEAAKSLALNSSQSRSAHVDPRPAVAWVLIQHRPPSEQWKLSSLEMGRPLGKGQFGRVYLVRTKTKPTFILALKTIYKSEVIAAGLETQVRREIEIQSNLRFVSP